MDRQEFVQVVPDKTYHQCTHPIGTAIIDKLKLAFNGILGRLLHFSLDYLRKSSYGVYFSQDIAMLKDFCRFTVKIA